MAAEENKQKNNDDATKATGTSGIETGKTGGSDAFASTGQTGGKDAFATTGGATGGATRGGTTGGGASSGMGGGQGAQSAKGESSTGAQSDSAKEMASQVGDVLRGDTGAAKKIVSQVKDSVAPVAGEALGQVKEKATSAIEGKKTDLAQGLGGVASTIRQLGDTLKSGDAPESVVNLTTQYGDSLARQVEQFSTYLERHNVAEMMRDVERFARRNPALFIGGAFALGLLGARFLKSSNPNQALMLTDKKRFDKAEQEVFHGDPNAKGSGEGVRPV